VHAIPKRKCTVRIYSLIVAIGRMDVDIERRIAQVSKAFGALTLKSENSFFKL